MVWTGRNRAECDYGFGGTNSTIYEGTTSLGAITGKCNGARNLCQHDATLMMSSGNSADGTTIPSRVWSDFGRPVPRQQQ